MDSDGDLDHYQNVMICSLCYFQHLLKFSSKSICNFLSYFAKQQMHTVNDITSLSEVSKWKENENVELQ